MFKLRKRLGWLAVAGVAGIGLLGTSVSPLRAAGEADLTVTVADSADPVPTGGPVTYTIEVGNAGPDNASSVRVDISLSATLDPGTPILPDGATSTGSASRLRVTVPSLAAGSSVQIIIPATAGSGTEAQVRAQVSGGGVRETNRQNNLETETTILSGGAAGVDLAWLPGTLNFVCKGTGAAIKCTYTGKLSVRNLGTVKSTPTKIRYYLSEDAVFEAGTDTLLKEQTLSTVQPGKTKKVKVKVKAPVGTDITTRFLFAVIDPDNTVVESDEKNNVIVFTPNS